MEDVYTIKVKTKPDTRNVYPSERRYSASTVSGLAWVHIALAATSFLLACLALVNPTSTKLVNQDLQQKNEWVPISNSNDEANDEPVNISNFNNGYIENMTAGAENSTKNDETVKTVNSDYILVLAPFLLTVFAMAAGLTAILASVRWYVDRNIALLFIMSVLSTIFSLTSFLMIFIWLMTNEKDMSDFYRDKIPFKDYFVVKTTDIVHKNGSHIVIKNFNTDQSANSNLFTDRVLSINILIASFLELLWSLLSIKISYKGMRNRYKEADEPRGNCVSVTTKIKGNNNRFRKGRSPPIPDSIEYPSSKIKRIFLAQNDNGFYLKNQGNKKNTDTSSECYKERMNNFLNRCSSLEALSNSEDNDTTVNLNPIQEVTSAEINSFNERNVTEYSDNPEIKTPGNTLSRMTPVSWGDTPEHTIYNPKTLNLEMIFNLQNGRNENNATENREKETENRDGTRKCDDK